MRLPVLRAAHEKLLVFEKRVQRCAVRANDTIMLQKETRLYGISKEEFL